MQVAALVGGNHVNAGGESEADAFEEWIGKADRGEVEVGVGAKKSLSFGVGGEEGGGCVGERGSFARLDRIGRFGFDFDGRLEQANEPRAEKAGECGSAAQSIFAARGVGYR